MTVRVQGGCHPGNVERCKLDPVRHTNHRLRLQEKIFGRRLCSSAYQPQQSSHAVGVERDYGVLEERTLLNQGEKCGRKLQNVNTNLEQRRCVRIDHAFIASMNDRTETLEFKELVGRPS
jgi:hypothetical protein